MKAYGDDRLSVFTLDIERLSYIKGLKWGEETFLIREARVGQRRKSQRQKVSTNLILTLHVGLFFIHHSLVF